MFSLCSALIKTAESERLEFSEESIEIQSKTKITAHLFLLNKFAPVCKGHRDGDFESRSFDWHFQAKLKTRYIALGVGQNITEVSRRIFQQPLVTAVREDYELTKVADTT